MNSSLEFHLIPFGIALLWYNSPNVSNIPYENQPAGAQNLLPCQLDVRPGTNGFFIVHFSCANNILITVETVPSVIFRVRKRNDS